MIIVNIYGGLGNQMFQYAFGKSLSLRRNVELKLDISLFEQYQLRSFLLQKFNLNYSVARAEEILEYSLTNRYKRFFFIFLKKYINFKTTMFFEKNAFVFEKSSLKSEATFYSGYWQNLKYFSEIRNILLKEFTLNEDLDCRNQTLLNLIIKEKEAVSIHIRRGDYLIVSKSKTGHALCPTSYYEKAISHFAAHLKNPYFFVFSDDIQWVKKNLKIDYKTEYIDFNFDSPEKDLMLIRNCKHNIMANSTFSWWGAWLNENPKKIVIYPRRWLNNLDTPEDLMESNWLKF